MTEPRPSGRRFAPVGAVVVGLLVIVLSAAGSYGVLTATAPGQIDNPPGARSPVPTPTEGTAAPSATIPQETAAAVSFPTPYAWSSADIESLIRVAPSVFAGSCATLEPTSSDPERSPVAIAAIECRPAGTTRRVVYERLADVPTAESTYGVRLLQAGVERDSGGCWDGRSGEVDYSYGRAACWIDAASGMTRVTWTDARVGVLASASAGSGNLRELVDWWWNYARLDANPTGAGLTVDEQFLLDQVPEWLRASCQSYDATTDPVAYDPVGDLGAIDCFPRDLALEDVGWFRFTTEAALRAWYERRIALEGIAEGSGGCYDGTPGETTWESGRIACYNRTDDRAAIRWINERSLMYGALNATNSDLPALFSWWQMSRLP